jgi:hypothetical protein
VAIWGKNKSQNARKELVEIEDKIKAIYQKMGRYPMFLLATPL